MKQVGTIRKAVYFDDWVFEDATTGSMIFEYIKDKSTDYVFEEYRFNQAKQITKVENNINFILEKYSQLNFPILSKISETFKGMAVKDRETFIHEEQNNNPNVFLLGNCIDRYRLKKQYYTDYSKLMIVGGTKNKSKHDIAPRILIRRTGNFYAVFCWINLL
jgi:NH3-dependent NAD+ synthetase